jgi:hypothetical protein
MPTYALPRSHQDVRRRTPTSVWRFDILTEMQLLEKSLVDTDPEVAEIMVPPLSLRYVKVTG